MEEEEEEAEAESVAEPGRLPNPSPSLPSQLLMEVRVRVFERGEGVLGKKEGVIVNFVLKEEETKMARGRDGAGEERIWSIAFAGFW